MECCVRVLARWDGRICGWTVMEYSLEIEGIVRTARGGDCLGDSREVEYEKGREGRRGWGAENSHHLSASRSR